MSHDKEESDLHSGSPEYAARFSGAVGQWFLQRQLEIVEAMLEKTPGTSVLDVGGGHGQLAIPLALRSYDVTVIGSSAAAMPLLLPRQDELKLDLMEGTLLDLPFANESFDIVVCFRLLAHCVHWKRLLADLCRVSRGSVIVDYPSRRSINCLSPFMFPLKRTVEMNTRPFQLFSDAEVLSEFENCGFKRKEIQKQFVLPMVFHRVLNSPALSTRLEHLMAATRDSTGSPVIAEFVRYR